MVDIAKILIRKTYKEAIPQKYNDSKISQYTVLEIHETRVVTQTL